MKQTLLTLSALALFIGAGASASANPVESLLVLENLGKLAAGTAHVTDSPQPGTCDFKAARSACTNSTDSYALNGCSVANGKVVLLGGWDEAFSGAGADSCTNPLVDGETVTQTSKGLTATFASGESVMIDTAAGTAYDGTVIPNTGVVRALAAGVTTVTVNGSHSIFKDKEGLIAQENYAVSSAPAHMTGNLADGSFVITDGGLKIFHQTSKYTSDVSAEKVAWSDKACCHPVSGKLTEVIAGANAGTRSLTFTAKCGTATMVDVDGKSSEVTLPACP